MILWWCCPPALPRPPGCFLCLPTRPCPADTCPRLCLLRFRPTRGWWKKRKEGSVLSVHALCRSLDASLFSLGGVGATDRVPSAGVDPALFQPSRGPGPAARRRSRAVGREGKRGVGLGQPPPSARPSETRSDSRSAGIAGAVRSAPRRAEASLPLSRSAAPRLSFFVTYGSSWLLSLWFSYWPRPSSCRPWCPLSRGVLFRGPDFAPKMDFLHGSATSRHPRVTGHLHAKRPGGGTDLWSFAPRKSSRTNAKSTRKSRGPSPPPPNAKAQSSGPESKKN